MILVAGFGLMVALSAADAGPPSRELLLEPAVRVVAPSGYGDDVVAIGDAGQLLTLSDGRGVLALTVYEGARRPGVGAALDVHTQELRRRGGGATTPSRVRQRFLGASRPARELTWVLDGHTHRARIVAARARSATVVAVWSWPDGDAARAEALRAAVEGVATR